MTRALNPVRALRPGNRAVLYLRQSKEREESESIETQEYLGREYCRERGYDIVDVKIDRVSGRKWDTRPGVLETLQLIEESRADVIILWKWSRLSRNRLHWALADDRVQLAGGRIESVTEPIDTSTASGRFARGVMTEYAAFQSESMGEIWAETLERRRRKGLVPSGGDRYGYNRDGDAYTPHPVEGPLLAQMFQRAAEGAGLASIARWLNESGHRTKRGNEWSAHAVRATLDSGFGAGLIHFANEYTDGAHPAVVSRELWESYRAYRASHAKPPRGSRRIATGLLRCICGDRMYVTAVSRTGRGDYKCGRAHRGQVPCAQPMSIRLHVVERYLLEWVRGLPENTESLLAAVEAEAAQRVRTLENRAALERMIGKAKKRLADLTVMLVDDKISQDAYEAAADRVNSELESLRARHVRAAPTPRRDLLELIPRMVDGFEELTPEGQNSVLKQLIDHIEIRPAPRPGGGVWRERFHVVPVWERGDD